MKRDDEAPDSPKKKRHSLSQQGVATVCVVLWFALNMVITNLNKWIFHKYKFGYPGTLTCMHMITCCFLGWLAVTFCFTPTAAARQPSPRTLQAVRRLSLVFVSSVAAGNVALKHIHISFAQSIGATAPLWTVLLSVAITRKTYPLLVYVALLLVSIGMVLCTTGEVNFNLLGFVAVLFATVTRALKSILQGLLLSGEGLDSISLLYHMSKPAALMLAAWVAVAERGVLSDPLVRSAPLWACILVSAVVSFFLNIAQFLVTKHTSPVTLQVLGNIKVVLLIAVSVAIFRNEVSPQSVIGCAISLSGVALYNSASRKRPREPNRTPTPSLESASPRLPHSRC